MEAIKRRTDVVWGLVDQKINAIYRATQIESAMLQLRMILELMVLASLSANKQIFDESRKMWEQLYFRAGRHKRASKRHLYPPLLTL